MSFWDNINTPATPTPQPSSGGFWDSIKVQTPTPTPAAPTPPPSPYWATTTKNGASFGPSPEKDTSGKPLLDYRQPGDTSTSTDRTRVDTTFDPTTPSKQPADSFHNPRDPSIRGNVPGSELDHVQPLELSGSNQKENLQYEKNIPGTNNTATDPIENQLAHDVATGKMSLFDAQTKMAQSKGAKAPFTGVLQQSFWDKVKHFVESVGSGIKNFVEPKEAEAATLPQTGNAFWDKMPQPQTPQKPESQIEVPKGAKIGDTFKGSDGKKYVVQSPKLEDIGKAIYEGVNGNKSLIAAPLSLSEDPNNPRQTDLESPNVKIPFTQGNFQTHLTGPLGAVVKAAIEFPERITQEVADIYNQTVNHNVSEKAVFQKGTQKVSDSFNEASDITAQAESNGWSKPASLALGTVYGVSGLILDLAPLVSGAAKLTLAATKYNAPLEAALNRLDIADNFTVKDWAEKTLNAADNLKQTGDMSGLHQLIDDYQTIATHLKAGTPRAAGVLKFVQDIAAKIESPLGPGIPKFDTSASATEEKQFFHGADAETAAKIKEGGFMPSKTFPGNGMVSLTDSEDVARNYAGAKGEILPVTSSAKNIKTYKTMEEYTNAIEAAPGTTGAEKEMNLNKDIDQVHIVDGDGKGTALTLAKKESLKIGSISPKTPGAEEFKAELGGSAKTIKAFENSTGQKVVGSNNEAKFVIGSFGTNAITRKIAGNQTDRLPVSELKNTIAHIKNEYKAGDSGFRKDNIVHIAEMPDGEKRAIITRPNKEGNQEVINLFKIGRDPEVFVKNLEKFGVPAGSRTQIAPLEPEKSNPLAYKDNGTLPKDDDNVKILPKEDSTVSKPEYGMSHRPTKGVRSFNLIEKVDGEQMIPKDMYEQWYGSRGTVADKESISVLKKIKGNPDANVTIYRASPSSDFNHGDWVTFSKKYAQEHAEGNNTAVHSKIVKAKDVRWAMDDINEFGYFPEQGGNKDLQISPKYHSVGLGPKASNATVEKLIRAHLPAGTNIKIVFNPNLIKEKGVSGLFKSWEDVLTGETKNAIELYTSGGKSPVRVGYHEAEHLIERMMPASMVEQLNKETLAKMTPQDQRYYRDRGYKTANERAMEYRADEAGKKNADKAGYKSPIQSVLDKINAFIQKIIDTAKAIYTHIQSIPNKEGGFIKNPLGDEVPKNNPIEEHLSNLETERANLKEALDSNPAKILVRYANPKTGELPQALGTGRSKFGMVGDQLAQDLGYKDSEEARLAYQNYQLHKKRLDILNKDIKIIKNLKREQIIEDKDAKSLKFFLDKDAKKSEAQLKDLTSQKKTPETQEMINRRKELATARMNRLMRALQGEESAIELEKPQTELEALETAQPVTKAEFEMMNKDFSYKPIIIDSNTPVKEKVGIIDYLRTPDRVLKKLGLPKVAAALRRSYENYLAELPLHLDVITDWKNRVPDAAGNKRIFNFLDGQQMRDKFAGKKVSPLSPEEMRVAKEIRIYLKDWADRLGLPEDNKISHYITHIFNLGENEKEFDEDIADLIRDRVPGSVYDPFLEKRLGKKGYIEDTWKSVEAYMKRAVRKANMDPALEKLKDAANHFKKEESQYKYLERLGARINLRPTEVDNLVDNTIKQIFGYRFGQRPVAMLSRQARQIVFRSMLGLNVGSAIKNLTQGVNTFATLGTRWTATGYTKLLTQGAKELEEQGILKQDFVQDRTASAVRKGLERLDKGLFFMFDMAEKVNRGSAYYGAKARALSEGLTEQQAINYAKKIVRDTQFQFGSIDTPVGLNSDITKLFTQFMSYGVKQTEFAAEMLKNKNWAGIMRYILASTILVYTVGKEFNIKWTDFVPGYSFTKFGTPPALALPFEIIKAVFDAPDRYGKQRTPIKKLEDVANTIPFPAGEQVKKSFRGYATYSDPKKKVDQSPATLTKALTMGPSNLTGGTSPKAQSILDKYGVGKKAKSKAADILGKYGIK